MCRHKTKTIHLLAQTSSEQTFTFINNSIPKVSGGRIELAAMVGVTSTGTYLSLQSDSFHCLQKFNQSSDATLERSPIAWFQAYPLATLSNQLPAVDFEYEYVKDVSMLRIKLGGDGTLTFAPGWYALWRLTLDHPMETFSRKVPDTPYPSCDEDMMCGGWD